MNRPNKRDYWAPSLGYFDDGTEELKFNINKYCKALNDYCDELEQKYADACIDYRQLMKLNKKNVKEKLAEIKSEKHLSWDSKAHKHHKDILNEIYSANKYYMTEQAKDAMLDAIECLDKLGDEQ